MHDTRRTAAEADQLAVASFVLGLLGLLFFNLVLGPIALTLAAVALRRRTTRPARALLGLTLGLADLALLATTLHTAHGTLWHLG
ncbi:DUF4190 domain-containing protein [Kitasatospora sp. NPDC088134]|uniref:DUF4190 domain-containing protein n=1 Tax=Kitasatospora sp. NPDC088134 TaxID=3364071 RepID=UPI003804C160